MEHVKEALKASGIDLLKYDATRGELDILQEAMKLPEEFEGVVFTKKRMVSMATTLSDRVTHGSVMLLDDPRQTNQMLSVNNNLQAIESPQGHGDSFWSVAMSLPEREEQQEAFHFDPVSHEVSFSYGRIGRRAESSALDARGHKCGDDLFLCESVNNEWRQGSNGRGRHHRPPQLRGLGVGGEELHPHCERLGIKIAEYK